MTVGEGEHVPVFRWADISEQFSDTFRQCGAPVYENGDVGTESHAQGFQGGLVQSGLPKMVECHQRAGSIR